MRFPLFQSSVIRSGLAAGALLLASTAAVADVNVTLTATPTTTTLPDGQVVPMWGLMCDPATAVANGPCTTLNPAQVQTGASWQPPLITVPQGQTLNISLVNKLAFNTNYIPTSLMIVGQLGGGLGQPPTRMPSPVHGPQGTTWPGTLGTTTNPGVSRKRQCRAIVARIRTASIIAKVLPMQMREPPPNGK